MQAIASVASVTMTVVLVIITARYVRLTKGLAEAANAAYSLSATIRLNLWPRGGETIRRM
jgi:cell division protein FtsX